MKTHAVVALLICLAAPSRSHAAATGSANWPQFRGPKGAGVSANTNLPDKWSATENVAWKTDLPGRSWSSPIVWGNHVFLTAVVNLGQSEPPQKGLYLGSPVLHGGRLFIVNDNDDQSELLTLEAKTGKELWRVDRDEKSNWATPFIWENGPRTELITSAASTEHSPR